MPDSSTDFPFPNKPTTNCRDLRFLIVDDLPDGRFLVSKTLARKFPDCTVTECATAESAFAFLEKNQPSCIIAHRTFEMTGLDLIRELRRRAPELPILMSSGVDRREDALAAGADGFLTYEEWLIVGNRVSELLEKLARPRCASSVISTNGNAATS